MADHLEVECTQVVVVEVRVGDLEERNPVERQVLVPCAIHLFAQDNVHWFHFEVSQRDKNCQMRFSKDINEH